MAQNEGKKFEEDFKKSIPDDAFVLRIKDPAQSFSMACRTCKSNPLRFSAKNPYDYLIFYNGTLFALELKTTADKSFSYDKQETKGSTNMIKWHQIEGLADAHRFDNVRAGFIFNSRNANETYFVDITKFLEFMETNHKKSINLTDIQGLCAIPLRSQKKRTRSCYAVRTMLDEILSCEKNNIEIT